MKRKTLEKRRLTWPESFFFSVVVFTLLTLSTATTLYVWTMHRLDDKLPGWVSSQVMVNRIMAIRNEQANLQSLYLIGMEREIRNYRMAVSQDELKDAAKRLENMIENAVGGK